MKKFLYVFIFILGFALDANAMLYDNCYGYGDFNDRDVVQVPAINPTCANNCELQCNTSFSTIVSGNELNSDHIYNCMNYCQMGVRPYTANIRMSLTDIAGSKPVTGPVCNALDSTAVDYPGNNYVQTSVILGATDNVLLTVQTPNQSSSTIGDGMVFKCGLNAAVLNPTPSSFVATDYQNYSTCGNTTGCTGNMTLGNATVLQQWNASWSSLNQVPTLSGLIAKDGDYITILYSGAYITGCNLTNASTISCSQASSSYDMYLYNVPDFSLATTFSSTNLITLPGSALTLLEVDEVASNSASWPSVLGLSPDSFDNNSYIAPNAGNTSGLTLFPMQRYVKYSGILSGFSSNTFKEMAFMHSYPATLYTAPLTNSTVRNVMGAMSMVVYRGGCPEWNGTSLQYAVLPVNTQPVESDWQPLNVPMASGTGPTNAVAPPLTPSPSTSCNAASPTTGTTCPGTLQNNQVCISGATQPGVLFLRVKLSNPTDPNALYNSSSYFTSCSGMTATPSSMCNRVKNIAENFLNLQGSTPNFAAYGSYNIEINKLGMSTAIADLFEDVVSQFQNLFYGDTTTGSIGLVQGVYTSFLADSTLTSAIRALLVLYVMWTGLSYLLGTAALNIQDGVVRLFKIAIITTLLSPTSWDFFNNYLFKLFMTLLCKRVAVAVQMRCTTLLTR
jgi:type IV secretion system protein VirB6